MEGSTEQKMKLEILSNSIFFKKRWTNSAHQNE